MRKFCLFWKTLYNIKRWKDKFWKEFPWEHIFCIIHQILPLTCLIILETLISIQRTLGDYPTHMDIHSYNTRFADFLVIPRSRIRTTRNNKFDLTIYNSLICKFLDVNFQMLSINSMIWYNYIPCILTELMTTSSITGGAVLKSIFCGHALDQYFWSQFQIPNQTIIFLQSSKIFFFTILITFTLYFYRFTV